MSNILGKVSIGLIKLRIPAQKAAPSGAIGPALGQKGLNMMEFCKAFNDRTKNIEQGTPTRVLINAYKDKTFTFEIQGSPTSYFIKKILNIEKGSVNPGRTSAGTITLDQIKIVAQQKLEQGLSARNIESAMKIVAGSARSMGLKIIGSNNG